MQTWKAGKKVIKCLGFDAGEDHRVKSGGTYSLKGGADYCPVPGIPRYRDRYEIVYPLRSWGITRQGCKDIISEAGLPIPAKSACFACLTGDTLVRTRRGLVPINQLVGQELELFAPVKNGHWKGGDHGSQEHQTNGRWYAGSVKSFGRQRVYELTIKRGSQYEKVIGTTADHRWVLKGGSVCTTVALKAGDVLQKCKSNYNKEKGNNRVHPSVFAIPQGFMVGDGVVSQGRRPYRMPLFGDKYEAMRPYLPPTCRVVYDKQTYDNSKFKRQKNQDEQEEIPTVVDFPRTWKKLPDIANESKSFLLGWLMGYFAADGEVANGRVVITSAKRENILFVKAVCAELGITTGKLGQRKRSSTNVANKKTVLYRTSIRPHDLNPDFFLRPSHRAEMQDYYAKTKAMPESDWRVVSVVKTDRVEEVFCAQVPEIGLFTLEDDLLTGNCPATKVFEIQRLAIVDPAIYCLSIAIELVYRTGHHFRGDLHHTVKVVDRITGKACGEWDVDALSLGEARNIIRDKLGDERQRWLDENGETGRPKYRYELKVSKSCCGLMFGVPWLLVPVELENSYRKKLQAFAKSLGHSDEILGKPIPCLTDDYQMPVSSQLPILQ